MKKNLDDIFNEKFKNAEITPPEEIWDNISAQLPFKKQKKRILPIWYLVAGTAAALVIMLFIFKDNFSPIPNQNITNSPENSINKNASEIPDDLEFYKPKQESILEQNESLAESELEKSNTLKLKKDQRNIITNKNSQIYAKRENITSNNATVSESKSPETEIRAEESLHFNTEKRIQNDLIIAANDSISIQRHQIVVTEDFKDLFNKDEVEESLKTSKSNRLSITTTAGALYFDNLGGGSGIDEQLANNEVSTDITTSYGINFGYQISQKVKIRTGISQIKMLSSTQKVAYSSILNSRSIEGLEFSSFPASGNVESVFGNVNQKIGFIEVPSELEYSILNGKVKLNLIGGFSTLILSKNNISISTENSSEDLGKVNNLSDISFTANAGLGLNYKISPRFNFNLEPIFKYQLNTFKDTKNFNPYYIGLYSGFSFKF